ATNPGNGPTTTNCTTTPNANGCPFANTWTTQGVPLNGGTLKINWITSPALSDTTTNEIQIGSPTEQNVFVLSLTDQYGNLTTAGGANVSLVATGSGELYTCVGAPPYSSTVPCTAKGAAAFTQPSGTPTYTIA